MISWSHKRIKSIGIYISLGWWTRSLQKHFSFKLLVFALYVILSLETKMFQTVICILGSPKREYLLPKAGVFTGQLVTCCKSSYVMRLRLCLGNGEHFPFALFSMTFIFLVIPFYSALTHLFLGKLDHILLESQICLKLLFSTLPLLFRVPNFTPKDYTSTMNSTSDLRLPETLFPLFLVCFSAWPWRVPFINYHFATPTLHFLVGCYQSTKSGLVEGNEIDPFDFRISPRVPSLARFLQECCIHF